MRLSRLHRILVSAALAMVMGAVDAGPLEEIKPGHWYEVPNSKLRNLDPCPKRECKYSAVEGVTGVIDDWNGGAFASRFGARGGYIVWGGGHNGYFGNELYVFDVAKLAWQRVTEPVADPVCDYKEGELQNGSPCAAHSYDYVDYHPATNSFVKLGSTSNHLQGGGGSPRVHLFSFDTQRWRRGARREHFNDQTGASSAYDPNRDVFWFLAPYRNWFSKYDPNADNGAGAWTSFQNYHVEIDAVAAIDPVRDLYVAIEGRETHRVIVFDLKNPTREPVLVSTVGDAILQQNKGHGFEWDPVNKLFVGWGGGTAVYTLRPPEKKWQTQPWRWTKREAAPDNRVTPGPENERGTYSRWRHVPAQDLWIVVNGVDTNVFFYRLNTAP